MCILVICFWCYMLIHIRQKLLKFSPSHPSWIKGFVQDLPWQEMKIQRGFFRHARAQHGTDLTDFSTRKSLGKLLNFSLKRRGTALKIDYRILIFFFFLILFLSIAWYRSTWLKCVSLTIAIICNCSIMSHGPCETLYSRVSQSVCWFV